MADEEMTEHSAVEMKEEYFHVKIADGSTVMISSDQLQQMQEGMIAAGENQEYVEGMVGEAEGEEGMIVEDPNGEMTTQQIHIDADGNIVTAEQMQDYITYHAVDSQGNLIEDGGEQGVEEMTEQVEIPITQGEIDNMMQADNIVEEEVIASTSQEEEAYVQTETIEESSEETINQQLFNLQDTIFNPATGTLQPITAATTTPKQTPPAPAKIVRKTPKPSTSQQMGTTKFVLQQTGGDLGQGQTLIMDPSQLHGIIQGGGSITLGAGGKNILLAPPTASTSKPKPIAPKSPAKILPAPVPSGDQQRIGGSGPKLMVKQGNVLTPFNQAQDKYLAVQTASGGVQYVRVVQGKQPIAPSNKVAIAPATIKPKPVAPKPAPGQTIFLPAGSSTADLSSLQATSSLGNLVLMPNFVVKTENSGPIPIRPAEPIPTSVSQSSITDAGSLLSGLTSLPPGASTTLESIRSLLEPNGMRPRKPCNCTKSQCLKLYCDCFANGEFCHLCNCTGCANNLQHEEDRQKAIKLVLERNPGAFRPKIGKSSQTGEAHERRHNKGCNCRRSGCLKNYCECYEAKIFCSGICKCTGCKNCIENIPSGLPNGVGVEQHFAGAGTAHRQTLKDLAEAAEVRVQQQNQVKNKMRAQMQEVSAQNNLGIMVPPIVFRYPHSTISYEVVTAAVELLLAKAEACEKQRMSEGEIEREVLEEFGDCLASVMELGSSVE